MAKGQRKADKEQKAKEKAAKLEKISIEIAWNNLIVNIYGDQIEIDQNAMNKELEKFDEKKVDNLLLSEIIFTINDKKELKLKYEEIEKSINEIGFAETARIYSLSDSKKNGGCLVDTMLQEKKYK